MLEQSIQTAQEIEKSLNLIQESLEFIDKQLTAYIADKVDAAQMPQEAQVSITGNKHCFYFYSLNVFTPVGYCTFILTCYLINHEEVSFHILICLF